MLVTELTLSFLACQTLAACLLDPEVFVNIGYVTSPLERYIVRFYKTTGVNEVIYGLSKEKFL